MNTVVVPNKKQPYTPSHTRTTYRLYIANGRQQRLPVNQTISGLQHSRLISCITSCGTSLIYNFSLSSERTSI